MKRFNFDILKRGGVALTALFALLAVSCVKESPIPGKPGKGEAVVTFSLNLPANATSNTRALEAADENHIETIEVLVFDDNGYRYTAYGTIEGTSATVNLVKSEDDTDLYDLVILANSRTVVMSKNFAKGEAKDEVLKALTATMSKWNADPTSAGYMHLPMSSNPALHTDLEITNDMNISVDLHRALARVNVLLSKKNEVPASNTFKLTSVRVYNYNTVGAIVPYGSSWDDHTTQTYKFRVTTPTIPSGTITTQGNHQDYNVTSAVACTNEIYIFEADNHTDAEPAAPKGLTDRTCLVIGGQYSADGGDTWGETTYYRADFHNSTGHLDVLRNHSYNFNIIAVSGPGFPREEDAFNAEPVNIECDVIEWNDGEMSEIIFDGQSYFGIDKKSIVFSPMGDETVVYNVITNIPDWSMWLGDSKKLDAQSAATYTNTNYGFTYSVTAKGGDKYQLTVTSNKHNIYAGGNERKEEFTIKALRLNIPFTVEQLSGSTYVSVINGDIARLYPEGTESGTVLPIDIMATKPVTVTISGDGNGSWVTLTGDQSGLSVASGSGIFSAKLAVNVDVFNPTTYTSFAGQLRTAQITITPQGDPSITYTITQEMPYIALSTGIVSILRSASEFSKAVDVLTNIQSDDLNLSTTAQDGYNRITADVLTAGDQLRPRFRRFTVTADLSTTPTALPTDAFSSVFAVNVDTKYGVASPSTTFIVYSGNDLWQWIWSWPGTGVTTNTYIFPWNTSTAADAISFTSSTGLEWDSGKEGAVNPASITISSPSGEDYPVSITFDNAYNTLGSYKVWFKNTDDSKTEEITFHKGVQVMDYSASVSSLGYTGVTTSSPTTLGTVTSNVAWKATMSGGSGWAQLRAGTGGTWLPNDGSTATVDNTTTNAAVYTGSNPGCITVQTPLQLSVEAYSTLNANPASRTATISFVNESYDPTKLGAAAPAPITVTQYAPVLTHASNNLPTGSETIPQAGASYTVNVSTNLQGWGVKVYIGTDNSGTVLVTKALGSSPVISNNAGAVASNVSVAIPNHTGTSNRTLAVYLSSTEFGGAGYTDKSKEIFVDIWEQSGIIINPGENHVLYFSSDGKLQVGRWGVDVTAVADMAFFKFGGVVGFTNGARWNDTSSIKFNPTATASYTYANVPVYASVDYTQGRTNVSDVSYHTGANIKAGKGDPCKLAGLTSAVAQAMSATDLAAYSSGWRLATAQENAQFVQGPNDVWMTWTAGNPSYSYGQGSTITGTFVANFYEYKGSSAAEPNLYWFPATQSASLDTNGKMSLPGGGVRNTLGDYQGVGKGLGIWSSTAYDGENGYHLAANSSSLVPASPLLSSTAYAARCVRQ